MQNFFDELASRPPAAPTGRLHPSPKIGLVRWMLDPVVPVSPQVREALVREIDLTPASAVSSSFVLVLLNTISCVLAPSGFFDMMLAINVILNIVRVLLSFGLARAWFPSSPAFTDSYIIFTLLWALMHSVFTTVAVASNVSALQTLCLEMVTAFQGLLCARNYPAPRFALTLFMMFEISMVAGSVIASDHWLWINFLLLLPWTYSSLSTIRRFQLVSIASLAAQFASEAQAQRDPLTDALNRMGLQRALTDDCLPTELTLFCLDLDGFKAVNDTFGHIAGDALLKLVTERLCHTIREGDILARPGGDEFIIVAPNLLPEAAESLAARLVANISSDPYQLGNTIRATIGVSVGIACRPQDGTSFDALLALADDALYLAKEQGKGTWRRSATARAAN